MLNPRQCFISSVHFVIRIYLQILEYADKFIVIIICIHRNFFFYFTLRMLRIIHDSKRVASPPEKGSFVPLKRVSVDETVHSFAADVRGKQPFVSS
jgi:hypothetical protein